MQLNPYLFFRGDCEAAFRLYAQVLDGKIEMAMRYEGSPAAGDVAPEWGSKIMHARLVFGDQVLMGSDAPPGREQAAQGFSISVSVAKPADADRIFHALAEKGTVRMPIQKTFWAERFGMLVDRFGMPWMINCEGAH